MSFFKMSLAVQMAVATALGILTGFFFGDLCSFFAPYGSAYIMLLKATAIPYLIVAIIHGVAQLTPFQAKLIIKKGIMFIGIAWSINIAMIYLVYGTFPKAESTQSGYISTETSSINFAELLIPENIFYDLANNIVPAIVIFSLFIGIALMQMKEKETLINPLKFLVEALTKITLWIAKITPLGTFLIIANQAGTIEFSTIKQISSYLILYITCVCTIIFWIFPRLTHMLTHINPYRWLKLLSPILLLAYTTNVVIVCIPYIIELLRKETQALEPFDEKSQTQIQGTVSVIFNLPMGSLFITIFVFFVSIFYHQPMQVHSQIELFLTSFLTSLGAVGIGSWINSLTFTLNSLGLPIEAVNLYLTTLPFTSGFQAGVSVMQISTLCFLITLACRRKILTSYGRILKHSAVTIGPVLLLFFILKNYAPLPEIKSLKKSIYELSISSNLHVSTKDIKQLSQQDTSSEDTFNRILRTKVLRVGFIAHSPPFSFNNYDDHLVGYDTAFAYELGYDLDCSIEFIPIKIGDLNTHLKNNDLDIVMSGISITEERLKYMSFTKPYMLPRFVFVTTEHNRGHFSSTTYVENNPHLRIAVLKGSSYEALAKERFPRHPLIYLNSYDDFNPEEADAILWEEQQAIVWSIGKSEIRVLFPTPVIGIDCLGYAINTTSPQFLNYLNQWLSLKETSGFQQKQYDLWVLGKTEIAAPYEPRWSILKNVLKWDE
ncbi:MAG: cation:dicarboxylase symporter family transporter [Chlamydiae bacterium]|nr:cation:dicarboxylase symporter family transporter [Chlamydiota bacterium]